VVLAFKGVTVIAKANFASLKDIKPHDYAIRFLFGGLCTVAAGLIAKRFGPGVGGLFLAFPAIFPAGASLLEKHEKEKKQKAGFEGTTRGRIAAGIDALGASIGCIGLAGFAAVLWLGLPHYNTVLVIVAATFAWLVLSVSFWLLVKSRILRRVQR
jgi:hypothetical protein